MKRDDLRFEKLLSSLLKLHSVDAVSAETENTAHQLRRKLQLWQLMEKAEKMFRIPDATKETIMVDN